jgi:hypothetical protein
MHHPGVGYVLSSTVPRYGYSRWPTSSCTVLDQLGAQVVHRRTFQDMVTKMFWVSLLAIFSNFNYFLVCCAILMLSFTKEHFCLTEGVSLEMANIVFDKAARKVIKDTIKHACLVSTALYYSQVLRHLLYLMTIFDFIIIFVVLLAGAEAADKAQPDTRHLPDQGVAASREGRLAHQRFGGLGRDVRVVGISRVQSHLSGTDTTNGARCRCTTTGWMVTSARPKDWLSHSVLRSNRMLIVVRIDGPRGEG